jgi:hypothetical protein
VAHAVKFFYVDRPAFAGAATRFPPLVPHCIGLFLRRCQLPTLVAPDRIDVLFRSRVAIQETSILECTWKSLGFWMNGYTFLVQSARLKIEPRPWTHAVNHCPSEALFCAGWASAVVDVPFMFHWSVKFESVCVCLQWVVLHHLCWLPYRAIHACRNMENRGSRDAKTSLVTLQQ